MYSRALVDNRYRTNWVASVLRSPVVYPAVLAALAKHAGPAVYSWSSKKVEEVAHSLGKRTLSALVEQFTQPSPGSSVGTSSVRPAKRARLNPVNMVGQTGYYAKKFRTKKVMPKSKVRINGYEIFREFGLVAGEYAVNDGAVFFGHGVAFHEMHVAFWGTVVRRLFQKRGHDIPAWNAKVQGAADTTFINQGGLNIRVYYRQSNSAALQNFAMTSSDLIDKTYYEVVLALHVAALAVYPNCPDFQLVEAIMDQFYDEGGTIIHTPPPPARVNLINAVVDLGFTSKIFIQNRSQAGTAVSPEDPTDVVDNNPVMGKVYEGFGNGFKLGYSDSPVTAQQLICDNVHGVVQFNNLGGSDYMDSIYKRPPKSRDAFVGCKRMGNVRLQPGQIRNGYLSYSKKMSVANWVKIFVAAFENGTGAHYFPLGKVQLYGFEKFVHASSTEAGMAFGVEVNQKYWGVLYNNKVETLPNFVVTQQS